jgi:hypothetical protein
VEQSHEALVHLELLVAMEKCKPRIICDEDVKWLIDVAHAHLVFEEVNKVFVCHGGWS